MTNQPVFDVTGAVAVLNQTFEYAFPSLVVVGELSEFRVSKGKWLYFDIKDDTSKLKCFGTIFQVKTPLEDGMMIEIIAQPRLHNLYGFSLNIQHVRPVGEGSLKKSANLLQAKLEKEGLFDEERKRKIPYPPERVALIASGESAAFADFIKIIRARWPYIVIDHYEVHVQGIQAEKQIVSAVHEVNEQAIQADAIVLIRGGGSADDLSAFSTESVTRSVAASRVPTIVAIGHEVDVSLAELAADLRASTPSNAAELLVPDRQTVEQSLNQKKQFLSKVVEEEFMKRQEKLKQHRVFMHSEAEKKIESEQQMLSHASLRLESYHPKQVLKRGYAIVKQGDKLVKNASSLAKGSRINVELESGHIDADVVETHSSRKRI